MRNWMVFDEFHLLKCIEKIRNSEFESLPNTFFSFTTVRRIDGHCCGSPVWETVHSSVAARLAMKQIEAGWQFSSNEAREKERESCLEEDRRAGRRKGNVPNCTRHHLHRVARRGANLICLSNVYVVVYKVCANTISLNFNQLFLKTLQLKERAS